MVCQVLNTTFLNLSIKNMKPGERKMKQTRSEKTLHFLLLGLLPLYDMMTCFYTLFMRLDGIHIKEFKFSPLHFSLFFVSHFVLIFIWFMWFIGDRIDSDSNIKSKRGLKRLRNLYCKCRKDNLLSSAFILVINSVLIVFLFFVLVFYAERE